VHHVTETLRESLSGKAVLLTGASGFVGKAVLAQCLHELPGADVTVLLRGDAESRLQHILGGEIFEGLDGSGVRAISGDLEGELTGVPGIDVLIHCAASVSFEQPLDEALELNSKGPARLLRALRDA
jgi:nucleoside-diphosphate-sugar epimerase